MSTSQHTRVAAVQFHVGTDLTQNLHTTLRMIDKAATAKPDLVVLPEFINHCSWYDESDPLHCHKVSVDLDGEFLKAIANKAKEHSLYLVANVTLRRSDTTCTGTSILYSPTGERLAVSDKQVLIGHENFHLQRAESNSPVVDTPIGRIGLYACMDGVVNETPRGLALRGAQILCNSLNSFAFDEADLHIPVRAAENKVFIVAANKVGPLIPEELVEPVGSMINIPGHFLSGAGESQIVAPDGTVLAKAPVVGEAVVISDINIKLADRKQRPDGTDIFASRRVELYAPIAAEPKETKRSTGASSLEVAVFQPSTFGLEAIEEAKKAIDKASQQGTELVVLPELFMLSEASVTDVPEALSLSEKAIAEFSRIATETGLFIATSVVQKSLDHHYNTGVLIGPNGIILEQPQLHINHKHQAWMTPGDTLHIAQLPFGRVAIIVGEDSIYPESYRLAVLQGAEVIIAPLNLQESWEIELGLPERAAENRLCIIAASRPTAVGASLFLDLWDDYTLMTPWKERLFDGRISSPLVTRAPRYPGLFSTTLHPERTGNKILSPMTHVVNSRPWKLANAIVTTPEKILEEV